MYRKLLAEISLEKSRKWANCDNLERQRYKFCLGSNLFSEATLSIE